MPLWKKSTFLSPYKINRELEAGWVRGLGSDRTPVSPGPGFGPDSRESSPNQTQWTTKEVRWVGNERATVVIANTTIAQKLYNWYGDRVERREWCKLASPLGHQTQPWMSTASESSHPFRFCAKRASIPDLDADCVSRVSRRTHLTFLIILLSHKLLSSTHFRTFDVKLVRTN